MDNCAQACSDHRSGNGDSQYFHVSKSVCQKTPIRMLRRSTNRSIRYRYLLYSYSPSNSWMTSCHFPPVHQCLCRAPSIGELIALGSAQSLLIPTLLVNRGQKNNFTNPPSHQLSHSITKIRLFCHQNIIP